MTNQEISKLLNLSIVRSFESISEAFLLVDYLKHHGFRVSMTGSQHEPFDWDVEARSFYPKMYVFIFSEKSLPVAIRGVFEQCMQTLTSLNTDPTDTELESTALQEQWKPKNES